MANPNDMPSTAATPDPPAAEPDAAPEHSDPPAAEPQAPTPPWGSEENFDPAAAWALVQNLRADKASLKGKLEAAQPAIDAAEQQRRDDQGEVASIREDLTKSVARESAWRTRTVQAEVKALAADRFVDADTVLALIGDVSGFIDGDDIDANKLQQRLDQLATDKPFLVKQPPPQGFTPNRGQGQSGTGQLPIDAQIKAAQDSGDIMASIALKQQKLYGK